MGEFLKDEVIGKLKGRIETLARDSEERKEFEKALTDIKEQIGNLNLRIDNEVRSTRAQIGFLAEQGRIIEIMLKKIKNNVNFIGNILISVGVVSVLVGLVLIYFGR